MKSLQVFWTRVVRSGLCLSAASFLSVGLWFFAGFPAHGQTRVSWTNLHPATSWYSYANNSSATQQSGQIYVAGKYHAALWAGSVSSLVDLHPPVANSSWVNAAHAGQQVGYTDIGGRGRAGFWAGTAASFSDLTPPWAKSAEALGVANGQQVGWANLTNDSSGLHAVVWWGNSNTCVDLHPPFWKSSIAYATSGSNQVGEVEKYSSGDRYAALWSGTAASFVELGPEWWNSTTVDWSRAIAAGGTNQAGFYQLYNEFRSKAALWSGSPQSFVSLHPNGATASLALATSDTLQAGTATVNGEVCLAVWRGTSQSFVNLGPIKSGLGTGLTNLTVRAISIEGNTLYVAGDEDSQAVSITIQLLPPSLSLANIQSQGDAQIVTLTWTNNGISSVLESSGAPDSGWAIAGGGRTTNENSCSAVVTNISSAQFFRLRGE